MRQELSISWRYLVTRRKEAFISLISVISIAGIAIGVMALIVVIAVMSGFDRDLRDKIVGNYSHITIASPEGIDAARYEGLRKLIMANPNVVSVAPYVQGQVLLKEKETFFAVGFKGIDTSVKPEVTELSRFIIQGSLADLGENRIIIGKELAGFLGVSVGSRLTAYSSVQKQHVLTVAGIFRSGMYDYDLNLVFTTLTTAQAILGVPQRFTALAIKVSDLYKADAVSRELTSALGIGYIVRTWMEANQNFFAALKLEKMAMFVILALIILVAAFNIASTLVVMVVEKTKDIGILKALGMSSAQIRTIFTCHGVLIGAIGTLLGGAGGVALCGLLKKYQFIKLPQDIYYIDHLPVALTWQDMIMTIASAFAITMAATVYPAAKAASLQPIEALRYE